MKQADPHLILNRAHRLLLDVQHDPPTMAADDPLDYRLEAMLNYLTDIVPGSAERLESREVPSQEEKEIHWDDLSRRTHVVHHHLYARKDDFPEYFHKYVNELAHPGYRYRCMENARQLGRAYYTHPYSTWLHVARLMKLAFPYCEGCESRVQLEVHHWIYEHYGAEPLYADEVAVVCRRCHDFLTLLDKWRRHKPGKAVCWGKFERELAFIAKYNPRLTAS